MTIGQPWEAARITSDNGVDVGATTNNILPLFGPARYRCVGFMCTTEVVDVTTADVQIVAVDGATETVLKTFVIPAMAVGAEIYVNLPDMPAIPAGSFGKLKVSSAAATGQGIFWVEFFAFPLTQAERAAKTAVTAT